MSVSEETSPLVPVFDSRSGLRFVVAFGIVSCFADITYEGMRSISGPYLALLGASGAAVGLIAGLGELLGYTLRLASGAAADRSRRYWLITLAGYSVQMIAVPALALAGSWPAAAALIVLERAGKAVRNPPRDVMLSQAGEHIGQGWAFGLHESLDQFGAMIGPLAVAAVLALRHDERTALVLLGVPAAITLLLVYRLGLRCPQAGDIAGNVGPGPASAGTDSRLPPLFWWYCAGNALLAFGFADYALVSYHFVRTQSVPAFWVPIFYAAAMGAGGPGSLLFGRGFDRRGLRVLVPLMLITPLYLPLVFFGNFKAALGGTLLWGFALGAHESVMAAAVARMVPRHRRARAYGLFMAIFGIGWFCGSTLLGELYDHSVAAVVWVGVAAQFAALVPILRVLRMERDSAV